MSEEFKKRKRALCATSDVKRSKHTEHVNGAHKNGKDFESGQYDRAYTSNGYLGINT